ncbi:MAG: hypothetical protein AUK00_05845 [Dehalococcoidia bacterium CG2_30_46_9]|nr:MAG: hypothetical protein AUK00_05845 [Dehalococcoidia bacterium CG2_30_46_9]
MSLSRAIKTLVQCDFDGTITEDDTSYLILDSFGQGDWRQLLKEYKEHRISVGQFNTQAFAMVKADKPTLLQAIKGKVKIRDGFHELVDYCIKRGFRLVIVSNGLEFYIKAILEEIGRENIETYAAQAQFHPSGMRVQYMGLDGKQLNDGLKEAYIKLFLRQGYKVVYVGNGDSDVIAAQYAQRIFARGELLTYCKQNKLECTPFNSLVDVIGRL